MKELFSKKFYLTGLFLIAQIGSFSYGGVQQENPDPVDLARSIFLNSTVPYQGHVLITHSVQNKLLSEQVEIYFKPPHLYRMEFLGPDGTVDRVVLTDGVRSEISFIDKKGIEQKYSTPKQARRISPDEEKNLMLSNYQVSLAESAETLGRPTWVLHLTPLVLSKPSEVFLIDKKTSVILETKRVGQNESQGSLLRFTKFEPQKSFSEHLFLPLTQLTDSNLTDSNGGLVPQSPPLMQIEERDPAYTTLPGGFSLLNFNQFQTKGQTVTHFIYTDGLVPLSLFLTPGPVEMSAVNSAPMDSSSPFQIGRSSSYQIYNWKNEDTFFTVVGDLPVSFLEQISMNLKTKQN